LAKKKGCTLSDSPNFEALMKNPEETAATRIQQLFDDVIEALRS
jgi:alpha-galactosidase/6-phospho-beta-glucosidase family protein